MTTSEDRKAFWQDRPTLITGCTGILGAALTQTLVGLGADVIGLVRDWIPQSELVRTGTLDNIRVVRGDVADESVVDRLFSEYEIDTCFHLAAQTIVGIANRMPVPTFETNIKGTWVIMEAARQWGKTKRIVTASSDKAYGEHEILPYNEDAPLQGKHPYDVSKSCADLIAMTYAHSYGLPVAVTRCGNMYGEGDLNWNRIVPGTIRSVLRGQRPVVRSDGSPRRDYVYVQDIADAYLTLAEAMVDGAHTGEAFNFGLDQPLSVLEMIEKIIAISPYPDLTPIIENNASNEIQNQYLDSSKAHEKLNWKAAHTLEEGLSRTIRWYADYFEIALG